MEKKWREGSNGVKEGGDERGRRRERGRRKKIEVERERKREGESVCL